MFRAVRLSQPVEDPASLFVACVVEVRGGVRNGLNERCVVSICSAAVGIFFKPSYLDVW